MSELKVEEVNEAVFNASSQDGAEVYGARFDGCVHVSRYYNGDTKDSGRHAPDADYLHVCDTDDHIEAVFRVIQEAAKRENFAEYWPKPVEVVQKLIDLLPPEQRRQLVLVIP